MDQKSKHIPLNRKRITKLFVGSIAMSVAIGWVLSYPYWPSMFDYPVFRLLLFVGILFFGLIALINLTMLLNSNAGLSIYDKGFEDNISLFSPKGAIPWNIVTGVDVIQSASNKFLIIYINNSEQVVERQSVITRFLMKQNNKQYGSPMAISDYFLEIDMDELLDIFNSKIDNLYS